MKPIFCLISYGGDKVVYPGILPSITTIALPQIIKREIILIQCPDEIIKQIRNVKRYLPFPG